MRYSVIKSLVQWVVLSGIVLHIGFAKSESLVGSIEGALQVNNGQVSYALPLSMPEDAFGLAPALSIAYQQGGGNDAVGIGFGLSGLSSIARCSKSERIDGERGGISFGVEDVYCLDGKRLILTGEDEYKVYNSYQTKIKRYGDAANPTHWKVWNANGYIITYGGVTQSKVTVPQGTLRWSVSEVADRFEHKSTYSYKVEGNVQYLDEIQYSKYSVKCHYKERIEDRSETYSFGVKRIHNRLLTKIEILSDKKPFYSYQLKYNAIDTSKNTQRFTKLQSITYCDKEGACLKPVSFGYKEEKLQATPTDKTLVPVENMLNYIVADMNNDGHNDACYYDGKLHCALNNTENGFEAATVWSEALNAGRGKKQEAIASTLTLLDINNDKKLDYCVALQAGMFCGIGNGVDGFSEDRFYTKAFGVEDAYRFIDINQDDYTDICAFTDKGLECVINRDGVMDTVPKVVESSMKLYDTKQRYTQYNFNGSSSLRPFHNRLPDKCQSIYYDMSYRYGGEDGSLQLFCQKETGEIKIPQPQMVDINGDGYQDICGFKQNDTNYYCTLGKGYDEDSKEPLFREERVWGKAFPLGELSQIAKVTVPPWRQYYLRAYPHLKAAERDFPTQKSKTESLTRTLRMADLNNDRLLDICYKENNSMVCRINTGTNFEAPKVWATFPNTLKGHLENTIQLGDRDGDGVADLSYLNGDKLMVGVNLKDHFASFVSRATILPDMDEVNRRTRGYTMPTKKWFGLKTTFHNVQTWLAYGPIKQVADTDGKSNIEICYRGFEGLSCIKLENQPLALLESVTNSLGLKTKINYGYTLSDGLYEGLEESLQQGLKETPRNAFVVKEIITDDGIGGTNSLTYHYGGFISDEKKGALGFRTISTINSLKKSKNITTFHREDSELNGRVIAQQGYVDNKLLSHTTNTYSLVDTTHSRIKRARFDKSISKTYDLTGKHLATKTKIHKAYNDFDQLTELSEETIDSTGLAYKVTTTTAFKNDTERWLLGKPTEMSVTHEKEGAKTLTKKSRFEYTDTGELSKQILEPDSALSLSTTYRWNSTRTQKTTQVIGKSSKGVKESRTSTATYDRYGRIIASKNALGQGSTIAYDDYCNKPSVLTGINGLQQKFVYDGLCRTIKEELPDGNTIETFYEWSDRPDMGVFYADFGVIDRDNTVYKVRTTDNLKGWSVTYYDAMERKLREVNQGSDNLEVYTDYAYNTKGELLGSTLPYYGSSISVQSQGEEKPAHWLEAHWVKLERDLLGRVIKQTQPSTRGDLVTTMVYDGFKVTSTSPKNFTKITTKNVLDQTIEIEENDGSVIKYTYDVSGNVIQTDTNGQIITLEYDLFNRKTTMIDPTMGTWYYSYNAFGELEIQTDAKGAKTTIFYDKIGRVTEKTEGGETTTFTYDTQPHGKGKLSSSSNGIVTKIYHYDTLGRVTEVKQAIDDKTFETKYNYNKASQVSQVTYPSGLHLNYDYEDNGLLKRITVPKKEIWDFSYEGAEKALEQTALYIYTLKKTIADMQTQVFKYAQEAETYRVLVQKYMQKQGIKESELNVLRESREAILVMIEEYHKKLLYLEERASHAEKAFGNKTFKYVKTERGQHYFKYSRCVKKNWKGHCERHENYSTTIPAWVGAAGNTERKTIWSEKKDLDENHYLLSEDKSIINKMCITKPLHEYRIVAAKVKRKNYVFNKEYKYAQTCNWGPKQSLNIARTFNEEADYYRKILSEQEENSNKHETKISMTKEEIQSLKKLQQQSEEKALLSYKQAQIQNAFLAKNIAQLNKQIQANQEAQETLTNKEDENTNVTLWKATSRSPSGKIQGEYYGNGLLTSRYYDISGTIDRIKTGYGTKLIRDIRYGYDARNNIITKQDAIHQVTEHYSYDDLDRITAWQYERTGTQAKRLQRQYEYDLYGNITYKTGVGTMYYNDKNQLTSTDLSDDFSYDANGNMLSGNHKTYSYTPFNKVDRITYTNGYQDYFYDESDTLVKKVNQSGTVTYHIGDSFEIIIEPNNHGNKTIIKHHIKADSNLVATYIRTVDNGTQKRVDRTAYIHRDALNSVDTVTDNHGEVSLTNAYTPYGENIQTLEGNQKFKDTELRGYTGHKQFPEANLINMNARIYDPVIARFTSPDTMIPHPDMIQSYNRYAYVYGNPIKYTDPSGHFIDWIFYIGMALFTVGATSDDPMVQKIGMSLGRMMMMGADLGLSPIAQGAMVGFTTGFIQSGGDVGEAFKNTVITAVSAGFTQGLADHFGHHTWSQEGGWNFKGIAAQGINQGVISMVRGGKFGHGFISAIAGKVGGAVTKALNFEEGSSAARYGGASIAAVFGGLASEATGGEFTDGALSAVVVYLFNDIYTDTMTESRTRTPSRKRGLSGALFATGAAIVDAVSSLFTRTEDTSDKKIYYHYTDIKGLDNIDRKGVIQKGASNGVVYVSKYQLNQDEVEQIIFRNFSTHKGRGEYVIAFIPKDGVQFHEGQNKYEEYHWGSLKLGRHIHVIYAGVNQF